MQMGIVLELVCAISVHSELEDEECTYVCANTKLGAKTH